MADQRKKQVVATAKPIVDLLKKIGDRDTFPIWKAMARNAPDILKYKEYQKNDDGSFDIDWYDLKGKSVPHLKWDANYWKNVAVGYNKQNRDYDNAEKWYNYHQRKLVAYETNPRGHPKGIEHQRVALIHYQKVMDGNVDEKMDSWLSKIHEAQHWAAYHENKIDMWVYDRPKYQKRINQQVRLRNKWQAKAKQYTAQKNKALARYKMYAQAVQQRIAAARRAKIDAAIASQVQANEAHHLTSIYRADHQDSTVIAVSEISPNETVSMNLPAKSIDRDMPEGDYANVSSIQLSGTYYVFLEPGTREDSGYSTQTSQSYADRDKQFKTLTNWAKGNHRVVVRGFAYWSSTSIQSISKQMDANGAANTLELSITFQYQRVAKIATAKQKAPTTKHKGRARRRGRKRPTTHKVKPGQTMYGIAGGNVKKLNAIKKANPNIKNPNLIYPGQKLVIPK